MLKNFDFFGAPVGVLITIDKVPMRKHIKTFDN